MSQKTISIGGIEYPVKLYHYKVLDILKKYNRLFTVKRIGLERQNKRPYNPETDSITLPDTFFFWAVYQLLDKTGFLFWKKPFRSVSHLAKNIFRDEALNIVNFLGENVFYYRKENDEANEEEGQKKS